MRKKQEVKIMNLGLQLYSLRGIIEKDPAQTLKKVAEIGYNEVEFAGYYDLSAAAMKDLLDANGLKAISTHVGVSAVTDELDYQIEYNLAVGNKNIVLASAPLETADDCKRFNEILNSAAMKAKNFGVKIGYHNHAYEFERTDDDGNRFIDILAGEDGLFNLQFDLYWVSVGGGDAFEYVTKYAGRQNLMHLKELSKDEPKRNVEIGDGRIDFGGLIALGQKIGVTNFIVEQENYTLPQFESCARSFEGVKRLGVL